MTISTLGYTMVICGQSNDIRHRYRGCIEKVKFGVPIQQAFSHNIPATLLVLLLKVNKEGPLKKDIWRAPGNQAQVRKLTHIMQHGRLVNIANFSVFTAASVIKKFLSKLPGGIFGYENEKSLFSIVEQDEPEKQREIFCKVLSTLPPSSQHLLILLIGTFRTVADSSSAFCTRMSAEAIGISVAPSLFHSCILDGQRAKLEDVVRFRMASEVLTRVIKGFGYSNLFPLECYEFYARITGRTLRIDDDWLFTFQYPARVFNHPEMVVTAVCGDQAGPSGLNSVGMTRFGGSAAEVTQMDENERGRGLKRRENDFVESTQSLIYLEWVHERQTRRMRTRSDWFLSPVAPLRTCGPSKSVEFDECKDSQDIIGHNRRPIVLGVVRKRSWRTHYVRPGKSVDQEDDSGHSQVQKFGTAPSCMTQHALMVDVLIASMMQSFTSVER